MTTATGAQHSMYYVAESTIGTTPTSPAFKTFRHTGTSMALTKGTIESAELGGRQVKCFRHGNKQIGGGADFELGYGDFDDFLEAALGGTWTTEVDTGAITANAAVGTFTRSTGSFITDGIAQYDIVTASGYVAAGDNGRFLVDSLTATVLTVTPLEGQTMSVEVGGGNEQFVVEANVRSGSTRRGFTLERYFADISQRIRYEGSEVDEVTLSVAAGDTGDIITGSVSFVGKDQDSVYTMLSGATYTAASSLCPFTSFEAGVVENGATLGIVTAIDLSFANGVTPSFVVGSQVTGDKPIGKFRVTGTMTVQFQNTTLLDKFVSETGSSIYLTLTDQDGNILRINLMNVKYNGGQIDTSGDGEIPLVMPFVALLDTASNTDVIVERNPV